MNNIYIDYNVCLAGHACSVIMICPVAAIKQPDSSQPPVIDYELCTQCGKCTRFCAPKAIKFRTP